MGLWSLKKAGEVGICLSLIICLMGAAAVAVETVPTKDPLGDFLSTYGMPGGVVGLLGWFLRHIVGTIDRLRTEVIQALKDIGKDHRESIEKLVERNAELEDRIFTSVVNERDHKTSESARALKLKQ